MTPEVIARHIAERCQVENGQGEGVILDAFCGCGGNTIQFAKYCSKGELANCEYICIYISVILLKI